MKLKRQCMAHYIDATFGASETPEWFLIGKDIEEMSVELNPSTEIKKNILGETSISDSGYEPSLSAEPYYASPEDGIYEKLKDIAMNRLTDDSCKTRILEVLIDKDSQPYDAWMEDVMVKPQSYGGDVTGVQIPFQVLFNGNRTAGNVTIMDKVPTFTKKTI